jgi:hypothetical protein
MRTIVRILRGLTLGHGSGRMVPRPFPLVGRAGRVTPIPPPTPMREASRPVEVAGRPAARMSKAHPGNQPSGWAFFLDNQTGMRYDAIGLEQARLQCLPPSCRVDAATGATPGLCPGVAFSFDRMPMVWYDGIRSPDGVGSVSLSWTTPP